MAAKKISILFFYIQVEVSQITEEDPQGNRD